MGLLTVKTRGAFGSELVHMSDGKLKRGSVYSLLGRLEKAGLVRAIEEPPTDALALPRTLYRITSDGVKARAEFAEYVRLPLGALGGAA